MVYCRSFHRNNIAMFYLCAIIRLQLIFRLFTKVQNYICIIYLFNAYASVLVTLHMHAVFYTINYEEWKDLKAPYCYTDKFLPGLNLRCEQDCFHQRNSDQSHPSPQLLFSFVPVCNIF